MAKKTDSAAKGPAETGKNKPKPGQKSNSASQSPSKKSP